MKATVIQLARRALPLMRGERRVEAVRLIADLERTENADRGPFEVYRQRAARAFEKDLHAIGKAMAGALHAESLEALRGLRHLLPGLMREANEAPALAEVLEEAMVHAFYTSFAEESKVATATANAANDRIGNVLFSEEPVVTDAMKQWRSRQVFETDLSSAELRGFSAQLRNRSVFSARTTNADYLKEVAKVVDDILDAKINQAEGRIRLMRKLKQLGYDPAVGFPQDMASIPPAERGSLEDLSSAKRIDLILETNVRMARGYAQMVAGKDSYNRYAYPGWELIRLYVRETPRGSAESKSVGWFTRWHDAGDSVGWVGAVKDPMIARKDSAIWQALGDGAGGYIDTLLNPFPPFAFGSGMAWSAVSRARCVELGLMVEDGKSEIGENGPVPLPPLSPSQKEIIRVFNEMPPDLQAELERELGL